MSPAANSSPGLVHYKSKGGKHKASKTEMDGTPAE